MVAAPEENEDSQFSDSWPRTPFPRSKILRGPSCRAQPFEAPRSCEFRRFVHKTGVECRMQRPVAPSPSALSSKEAKQLPAPAPAPEQRKRSVLGDFFATLVD